ncbi:MAG: LarC family nickel insertion protein [Spirochaetia bacterium]|nr:LarC family nickel insertion protein [Spirochaetia bacterium]
MDLISYNINSNKKIKIENYINYLNKGIDDFIKTDIFKILNKKFLINDLFIHKSINVNNEKLKTKDNNFLYNRIYEFEFIELSGIIYYSFFNKEIITFIGDFTKKNNFYEIHCNLDNETPEQLSIYQKSLLELGANDAWFENIVMKKSRPAVKLCVLIKRDKLYFFINWILKKSKTLGVRYYPVHRLELYRTNTNTSKNKEYFSIDGKKNKKPEADFLEKEFMKNILI